MSRLHKHLYQAAAASALFLLALSPLLLAQDQQHSQDEELQQVIDRLSRLEELQQQEIERQQQLEELRRQEQLEFEAQQERLSAEWEQLDSAQQTRIDQILELNRRLNEERERIRQTESDTLSQRQSDLERDRMEQEAQLREQFTQALESTMQSSEQTLRTTTTFGYLVIIGLGAAGLIIVGLAILFVIVTLRQQKIQQQQFANTMQIIQAMQSVQQNSVHLAYTPTPDGTPALPPHVSGLSTSISDNEPLYNPEDMRRLLAQCHSYAAEIDQVTRRKNAAKAVAELVYKVSIAGGIQQEEALLHYAAGLVYDIGFLTIDSDILAAKTISEEQFKTIKTHTTIGLNMVHFVPREHRQLFKDAVSKHHENLDGTGYPAGLKQGDIPYIARSLRIAESYIALISSRDYRDILDREAAFEELYNKPNHYDQHIVKLLDNLI